MEEQVTEEARKWAMLCHLSAMLVIVAPYAHIVAPLLIWLLKRDTSPFVDDQGKEALNYNLSIMIYATVIVALGCGCMGCISVPALGALGIFDLICMIVAAGNAHSGKRHRYPLTIRFLK